MKKQSGIKMHVLEAMRANREMLVDIMQHANTYLHTSDIVELSDKTDTITRELGMVLDEIEQAEASRGKQ